MKTRLSLFLLLGIPFFTGAFLYKALPDKPKFSQFAEFYQERYDVIYNNARTLAIPKEDFVAALKAGDFKSSDPGLAYKNIAYPYDPDLPRYNGAFSLNDGTLFIWKIPREGIIEIQDSQYRTGFIFYPKEMLKLTEDKSE